MAAPETRQTAPIGQYPCPHCAGEGQGVFGDDGALEPCPTCLGAGHVEPAGATVPRDADPNPAHWLVVLLGAGLGVGLALLALVGMIDSCEGTASSAHQRATDVTEAARELVRQQVIGPRVPAEFPPEDEDRVTDLGNDRYLVSSHVDVHRESAGAKVRHRYTLVVQGDGHGGWRMESATMIP